MFTDLHSRVREQGSYSIEARKHWLLWTLLLLASIHCGRSIFFVNVTGLDLNRYEHGAEMMPFQARVAVIPVLRWAHGSSAMNRASNFLNSSLHKIQRLPGPEQWTPEKVASLLIGISSIAVMVIGAARWGMRHAAVIWWLPAVLTLAILYVTNAARYEMPFWFTYDLPHAALFGMACVALGERRLATVLILFLVDTPVRETSIYLAALVLAVGYVRQEKRKYGGVAAGMIALWLPIHFALSKPFLHNPSDTGIHTQNIKVALINPLHWPQILSAFGFLAIPVFLGRRHLSREASAMCAGALPCLLATLIFGIWYETRIWNEWTVLIALVATEEVARRYGIAFKATA